MENIKRGEIRYIDIPYSLGHEMAKNRPGIILSANAELATIVYLTSVKSKTVQPTHVTINSSGTTSWAKCEHIYTVDLARVKNSIGKCSDVEMKRVESAVRFHLGLSRFGEYQDAVASVDREAEFEASREELEQLQKRCVSLQNEREAYKMDLLRMTTQRDLYKELYEGAMSGNVAKEPEKPKKPTFGSRLREAREAKHMTQAELCRAVGISKSTLSHCESGHRMPKMEYVVAIAKALDVELTWLCCVGEE